MGTRFRVDPALRDYFPPHDHPYEVFPFRAVAGLLRPGMIAVDVGANVGIFTLLMARHVGPGGRVHAFEPHPELSRFLRSNVELNDFRSVCSCVVALVGGSDRECVAYHVSPQGLHVASTIYRTPEPWEILERPMLTLDRYFRKRRLRSLIKVDAEGAELQILRGAEGILRRARPLIVCEVHGKSMQVIGDSVEELFAFAAHLDYRPINLVTLEEFEAAEFVECTEFHYINRETGQDVAYLEYGHILFAEDAQQAIQVLTAAGLPQSSSERERPRGGSRAG